MSFNCLWANKMTAEHSKVGHTQRKLEAWNWFHKTGNYSLIKKSHSLKLDRVTWNNYCTTVVSHIICSEDGESIFLRNIGIYLRVYMASQFRRITLSSSLEWEPKISPVRWSPRECLDDPTCNQFYETEFFCVSLTWDMLGNQKAWLVTPSKPAQYQQVCSSISFMSSC
jgi:hypothetical protein